MIMVAVLLKVKGGIKYVSKTRDPNGKFFFRSLSIGLTYYLHLEFSLSFDAFSLAFFFFFVIFQPSANFTIGQNCSEVNRKSSYMY